jgi:hypothetical protein
VDVASESRKAGQQQRFHAPQKAVAASGGRSVDARAPHRRRVREEKELKSRNFLKPSRGLEPRTPSLPSLEGATVRAFSSTNPKAPCRDSPEKPAICGAVLPGCYLKSRLLLRRVVADGYWAVL